jgi:hypothetical protein
VDFFGVGPITQTKFLLDLVKGSVIVFFSQLMAKSFGEIGPKTGMPIEHSRRPVFFLLAAQPEQLVVSRYTCRIFFAFVTVPHDVQGDLKMFKVLGADDLPDRKVALRRLRTHHHVYQFSPLSPIHQVKPVMSDVTIRVPQDIVQALLLPPDVVAVELQRERGNWHSTSGASSLPGRRRLLQG